MQNLTPIFEHLSRCRTALFATADRVPESRWLEAPRAEAWSAGEVLAHLAMVEGAVVARAATLVGSPPPSVPWWKRVHVPVRFAEGRVLKIRSPIPLDQKLLACREETFLRLTDLRKRSLELLEDNRERDLSGYCFRHPLFGYLNYYDWFRLLGYHELRHTKQVQEIVDSFQK